MTQHDQPLVSCIMPTYNRRQFVPQAIKYFLLQDYMNKELVILDDGEDTVADLVLDDPHIQYFHESKGKSLGAKRNRLCELANGDIIAHWDDDDWYASWRLSYQVGELSQNGADACGLDHMLFLDAKESKAWEYIYSCEGKPWVYGATLCYRKELWLRSPFPEVNVGEDTRFVQSARGARIHPLPNNRFFVGTIHGSNTSPKQLRGACWRTTPLDTIRQVMGNDLSVTARLSVSPEQAEDSSETVAIAEPAGDFVCSKVSIGIYIDEDASRLLATLHAIQNNTPSKVEILLLPDGPDESMRSTLAGLSHLKQVGFDGPRGAAACFNRLLCEGEGDVLVFLESGALVGPGWLELILDVLSADSRNGLAGPSTNRSWNMQCIFPHAAEGDLDVVAQEVRSRFGSQYRMMDPLYCLADFCYAVRRDVVERVGAADECYSTGPCWEMDYSARAVRAGFRPVWAQGAFVLRLSPTSRRKREEVRLFDLNKRLYQDRFCGRHLLNQTRTYKAHCSGEACPHFAPADLIRLRLLLNEPSVFASNFRYENNEMQALGPAPMVSCLVSCIMPTRNRSAFLPLALACFEAQDYPNTELIIVEDGEEKLDRTLLEDHPRVRYVRLDGHNSIGHKRNIACREARGNIILHWDDDDWYGPQRISCQISPLIDGHAQISGIETRWIMGLPDGKFWAISPKLHQQMFVGDVHGGTIAYMRDVWETTGGFPDVSLAEDACLLRHALERGYRLVRIANDGLFVYVRHNSNAWDFPIGRFLDASAWSESSAPSGLSDEVIARYRSAARRLHLIDAGEPSAATSLLGSRIPG